MGKTKFALLMLLISISFKALEASYKSGIYNAYITSNMLQWKKIMDEMHLQQNKSNELILELLNYQYGYIAWNIGNNKHRQAEVYLKLGEQNIKILEKSRYKLSLVNSYKSAFYGFKVAINKLQAPFIGPKSVECAKLAIKLDAANPFGYIQLGNTEYYIPSFFGGSKTVALEYYKKAEKLMEQETEVIKEDWNYLNLLTMIALAYQELKIYKSARAYFDRILKIEPNYKWVKEDLYPALLKKMS